MFIRRKVYDEILARLKRLEEAVFYQPAVTADTTKDEQKKSKSPEQLKREWLLFEDERKGASV